MRSIALSEPICGACDGIGRLVSADLPLRRMQLRSGGEDGGVIALPELLDLCRYSARIDMKLARTIEVSDQDKDYRFLVETDPADGQVQFCIIGWWEAERVARPVAQPRFALGAAAQGGACRLQLDSGLRIVAFEPGPIPPDFAPPVIAAAFTDWAQLIPAEGQGPTMLEAVAERQAFRDQPVQIDRSIARLSGQPLLQGQGEFAGYICDLVPDPIPASPAMEPLPPFPVQLASPNLKQPLNRIVANAQTIHERLRGPIRANYAGYARDIASAASHLRDLVEDFGDLEAVERADFMPDMERIDCAELARRAAGLLAVRASDHNITVNVPAEDARLFASGEYKRVLQILVNLIGNAISYAPDGTSVTVSTEIEGGQPAIVIADQGTGIAPSDCEKAFEKFERLGRSGDGGSGLGLYISRRLARAMGGDLTIAPSEEGARFLLSLPPA